MKAKLLLLMTAILIGHNDLYAQVSSTPAPKVAPKEKQVVLSENNLIVLNEAIMPETMGKVLLKAKQLDAALTASLTNKIKEKTSGKKTPLYIFVNSPGGSIQTGLEMMESIKGLGRPVHTVTMFAASMAWQLVQNFDERYILRNGVMMSHRASGGFSGEFGGQFPSQIDSRQSLWYSRIREMDEQTVKRTNGKQTMESYQKAYASELWRTGSQSVEEGYSDAVSVVKCDETLAGVKSTDLSLDLGIAKVELSFDLDKCPTNTNPMNIRVTMETTRGKMTIPVFLAKGGQFGQSCLQSAATPEGKDKLCASDATLDLVKINDAVEKFKSQGKFDATKQRPLPMYW